MFSTIFILYGAQFELLCFQNFGADMFNICNLDNVGLRKLLAASTIILLHEISLAITLFMTYIVVPFHAENHIEPQKRPLADNGGQSAFRAAKSFKSKHSHFIVSWKRAYKYKVVSLFLSLVIMLILTSPNFIFYFLFLVI